jgi:hypothetical protein
MAAKTLCSERVGDFIKPNPDARNGSIALRFPITSSNPHERFAVEGIAIGPSNKLATDAFAVRDFDKE